MRNLLKKHKEEMIEERDKQIYDHLTTNVFNPKKATLLRNTLGHSMRTSNYMQNTWKFNRMMDGTKVRNRLAPDSKQWAPEPINMRNILETEATSIADLQFKSCNNGIGATVGGGKYSVDGIMIKIREDSKKSRNGGFVQACMKDDPGITGDGAQLSKKYSGVRVSLFAGSTDCLNQSSLEIYNLAIYKVKEQAESYATLTSNLADVLPALKRIYRDGGLLRNADGSDSGVYVRCLPHAPRPPYPATRLDADAHVRVPTRPQTDICLVGDKPFLRYFCGLQSHNSKGFGAPFCNCTDENLYNFTLDPATHYTGTNKYESLCGSCHVAPWEV